MPSNEKSTDASKNKGKGKAKTKGDGGPVKKVGNPGNFHGDRLAFLDGQLPICLATKGRGEVTVFFSKMFGLWWAKFPWYEGYGADGKPLRKVAGLLHLSEDWKRVMYSALTPFTISPNTQLTSRTALIQSSRSTGSSAAPAACAPFRLSLAPALLCFPARPTLRLCAPPVFSCCTPDYATQRAPLVFPLALPLRLALPLCPALPLRLASPRFAGEAEPGAERNKIK
ncbi:hypothetical protein B0H13DRAFT_2326929 [Mycena leptocephala]|nr:hypothetical protein B0H13DRAFT_2326929 [Mycena leptocephala]